MKPGLFYPYLVASDVIKVHVEGGVDGFGTHVDSEILLDRSDSDSMIESVTLLAEIDYDRILTTVDDRERSSPPVRLDLIRRSIDSRRRDLVAVTSSASLRDPVSFTVALSRQEWCGDVTLQLVCSRTSTLNGSSSRLATDCFSRLAWSPVVTVRLDPPVAQQGGSIRVRWESFSRSPTSLARKNHPRNLFDIDVVHDVPEIVLNEDIEYARHVLDSRGTTGVRARIRNATNYMIAHQCWTSLLAIAITELSSSLNSDSGLSPEEAISELSPWQSSVLVDWSTHLYPGQDRTSAIASLVESVGNTVARAELFASRIPSAIQRRWSTPNGFAGLVRDHEALSGEREAR